MEFRRKHLRLARTAYLGHQWYFLTTCTRDRLPRLNSPAIFNEHRELLRMCASDQSFALQSYCFMPDHLHLLVSGESASSDCMRFIDSFKQRSGYKFKQRTGDRLWPHKSYDHMLRPGKSWEAVAWYIWMNPVRMGLCAGPEDWPYSGSMTFDWQHLLTPPEEPWIPAWKRA